MHCSLYWAQHLIFLSYYEFNRQYLKVKVSHFTAFIVKCLKICTLLRRKHNPTRSTPLNYNISFDLCFVLVRRRKHFSLNLIFCFRVLTQYDAKRPWPTSHKSVAATKCETSSQGTMQCLKATVNAIGNLEQMITINVYILNVKLRMVSNIPWKNNFFSAIILVQLNK